MTPLYDNEESVCGIIYNGSAYYFYKNLQGDIIEIANRVGTVVARYSYDAWGKVTAITDGTGVDISNNVGHIANANPFRYRGYYYDTEIEKYYLQSRYYDPMVGKFVNGDDVLYLVLDLDKPSKNDNLFAYCANSPVIYVDYAGTNIGYINNQNNFEYSNMNIWRSNTTMATAGCGYVAVYNVMRCFSSKVTFKKVVNQVKISGGITGSIYNWMGSNGLAITSIIAYLKSKFFSVKYRVGYSWSYDWLSVSDFSDAIIVNYFHNSGRGHYVAGIREGYNYRFYNCTLKNKLTGATMDMATQVISMYDFIKLLQHKKNDKKLTGIVGVRYKMGWW